MFKMSFRTTHLFIMKFTAIILFIQSFQCSNQSAFLQETEHLDFSNPVFSEVLSKVTSDNMPVEQKLEKLFYFTRDSVTFIADASLSASEALQKMKAVCYTKAMIYVSFCRRLKVPARLASEKFVIRADPNPHFHNHGTAKIYFNGKWIYLDTVSNREAWNLWKIPESTAFEPPEFSLERNVVVDESYISDLVFEDFETNDVPERWIKQLKKFKETGSW